MEGGAKQAINMKVIKKTGNVAIFSLTTDIIVVAFSRK